MPNFESPAQSQEENPLKQQLRLQDQDSLMIKYLVEGMQTKSFKKIDELLGENGESIGIFGSVKDEKAVEVLSDIRSILGKVEESGTIKEIVENKNKAKLMTKELIEKINRDN